MKKQDCEAECIIQEGADNGMIKVAAGVTVNMMDVAG
jgi:hypothetical protein